MSHLLACLPLPLPLPLPLSPAGKMVLVDLAGSERLKETGNVEREATRESGHINKSLFTLGQVLAALSVKGAGERLQREGGGGADPGLARTAVP